MGDDVTAEIKYKF